MKKIISAILAAVMLFSLAVMTTASGSDMTGDLNSDSKITAADARVALRIAAGLVAPDATQKTVADVNGDGKITAADARKILRVAAGLDKFSNSGSSSGGNGGSSGSSLVHNPNGTVFIAVTSGTKYHRETCRTIKDSVVICVAVADAQAHGYSACKVCDP